MAAAMTIIISPSGDVLCIYDEAIDLSALGQMQIVRASRVEPDVRGAWWADLEPVAGPALGPFTRRSEALRAEAEWLDNCWLTVQAPDAARRA